MELNIQELISKDLLEYERKFIEFYLTEKILAAQAIGTIISFRDNREELQKGNLSVTYRFYTDRYAKIFINAFNRGKFIPAFSQKRRDGGYLLGYLRLNCEPYKQNFNDITEADLLAAGFPHLPLGFPHFSREDFLHRYFRSDDKKNKTNSLVWVLKFDFIPKPRLNREDFKEYLDEY